MFILFPAFFWGLLPRSLVLGSFLGTAFIVAAWWATGSSKVRVSAPLGLRLSWIAFAAWALLSHYINADNQRYTVYLFFVSVFLMIIASSSVRWIGPAVTLLGVFGFINAATTVVFSVDSSFFDSVLKPRFYPSTLGASGYMSGLTPHFSYNATYIVYALLVITSVLVFAKLSKPWQFLFFLSFFLTAFALVLTSKRAHMLVSIIAIVAIFGTSKVRGRYFKLLLVALLVVSFGGYAALKYPSIAASLDRLIGSSQSADLNELTTGRVTLWEEAISGGNESPLFGQGWSTFYHDWTATAGASHAHNEFLEVFYSLGYPGVIVFTILILSTFLVTFKTARIICRHPRTAATYKVSSATALALQVFLIIYGATTGTMFTEVFTFVPYFLSVAIAFALSPLARTLSVGTSEKIQ
jgi:O-antigen ligase